MSLMRALILIPTALLILPMAVAQEDDANPRTHADPTGFFTAEQADRGYEWFDLICFECHDTGEFRDEEFEWTWRRQTAWDFFLEITANMPEDRPGELEDQTYVDIIAYVLQMNGYQEGDTELLPTAEALSEVQLGPGAPKTKGNATNHDR